MDSTTDVITGSIAPDVRAPTSNGQTLDRAAFFGKVPVVLVLPAPDRSDLEGRLRAVVPLDTEAVDDLLSQADALKHGAMDRGAS